MSYLNSEEFNNSAVGQAMLQALETRQVARKEQEAAEQRREYDAQKDVALEMAAKLTGTLGIEDGQPGLLSEEVATELGITDEKITAERLGYNGFSTTKNWRGVAPFSFAGEEFALHYTPEQYQVGAREGRWALRAIGYSVDPNHQPLLRRNREASDTALLDMHTFQGDLLILLGRHARDAERYKAEQEVVAANEAEQERVQARKNAERERVQAQMQERYTRIIAALDREAAELQTRVAELTTQWQRRMWQWPEGRVLTLYEWEWQDGRNEYGESAHDRGWSTQYRLDEDGFVLLHTGDRTRLDMQSHLPVVTERRYASIRELPPQLVIDEVHLLIEGVSDSYVSFNDWFKNWTGLRYTPAGEDDRPWRHSVKLGALPNAWVLEQLGAHLPEGAGLSRYGGELSFVAALDDLRPADSPTRTIPFRARLNLETMEVKADGDPYDLPF